MPAVAEHQTSTTSVVVLLGGPGSGKGTHGQALAAALGYEHLSSGEHFRDHIRRATPLGRRASECIENGHLVSDELAIELVREMLGSCPTASGFVLDGYPRSLAQAEALEGIASALDYEVTQALYLAISDDEIVRRLSGRLTCKACGRTCHETSKPPARPACAIRVAASWCGAQMTSQPLFGNASPCFIG
jgi:adenylate kinase